MLFIFSRVRGAFPFGAKIAAAYVVCLVWLVTQNFSLALACGLGYVGGESWGWGEWVGGLIHLDGRASSKRSGTTNGIAFMATQLFTIDTPAYHITALFIRGVYWWLPALLPLCWVVDADRVVLAVLLLAMAFPVCVLLARDANFSFPYVNNAWERSDLIYGLFQDGVFAYLLLQVVLQ